jgi:hypothetical protein
MGVKLTRYRGKALPVRLLQIAQSVFCVGSVSGGYLGYSCIRNFAAKISRCMVPKNLNTQQWRVESLGNRKPCPANRIGTIEFPIN